MAYSESPVTVERMLEYLTPLLDSTNVAWNVEPQPGAARRFAYKLREALHAATLHEELFPELAKLGPLQVRVVSRSRVEVQQPVQFRVTRAEGRTSLEPDSLSQTEVETRGGLSLDEIIARWDIGAETKLYFPKADLSREDLLRLWEWAQAQGVIFFENSGALTLMPFDAETATYAWSPEDEDA